jgi:hypothetical protein
MSGVHSIKVNRLVKTLAPVHGFNVFSPLLGIGLVLFSCGCSYRLPVITPASQQRFKVLAKSPELYAIRVHSDQTADYPAASDGTVIVNVPAYRPSCGVYLFDKIKVGGGNVDLNFSLMRQGKVVQRFSFAQIRRLRINADGAHLIMATQ